MSPLLRRSSGIEHKRLPIALFTRTIIHIWKRLQVCRVLPPFLATVLAIVVLEQADTGATLIIHDHILRATGYRGRDVIANCKGLRQQTTVEQPSTSFRSTGNCNR